MLTRDLMTREVEVCILDDSVENAVGIMERRNCGFVPVISDTFSKNLIGVVTDRDIALFLGRTNRRPSEVKVSECCTFNPKCVVMDTDIHDVANLMKDFQIHRVPVVDDKNRLLGVIALKDLAQEAWEKRETIAPDITEHEIAKIVEAISIV